MRRHHRVEFELAIGLHIRREFGEAAFINRHGDMRVGHRPAMTRKMLAAGDHAGTVQAFDEGSGEFRNNGRIAMKRTVTDHRAASPVKIKHRGEGHINTARTQFGSEDVAYVTGRRQRLIRLSFPQLAEATHRRQARKAFTAALHPAPS